MQGLFDMRRMNENNEPPQRRSIRLENYDYSNEGAYFVTICVQDKKCILGKISKDKVALFELGKLAEKIWLELQDNYTHVYTDEFVIMPNHIHGIIILDVGAGPCARPQNKDGQPRGVAPTNDPKTCALSLSDVIHRFKSFTTNQYYKGIDTGKWKRFSKHLWQRNFYEHVIRNEDDLNEIRQYIIDNPANWALDRENPDAGKKKSGGEIWET